MKISMEKFVKIADEAVKTHSEEFKKVIVSVVSDAIKGMYENGLTTRNYKNDEHTAYEHTWEYIMILERLESRFRGIFDLEVWMQQPFNELVKELESK